MRKSTIARLSNLIALLAGLVFLAFLSGCDSNHDHHDRNPGPKPSLHAVKHLILFIGDGMQLENEIAASRYLYGTDHGLAWHSFPFQGYVSTWDVNAYNAYASAFSAARYDEETFDPVIGYDPSWGGIAPYPLDLTGNLAYLLGAATDSASAATAYATGVKTDSGNLSWRRDDPADGALKTIAQKMRSQKHAAIGVVTTVPFNHATPAAFVSHNPYRENYAEIADEIINITAPEVVIGGGHPDWNGGYVTAAQLDALRASTEYSLVERIAGQDGGANLLAAASALPAGKKLFGLFGGGGGDFEPPEPLDTPGSPGFTVYAENPSLAAATEAALTVLGRNPKGFFLMVESGDIDWANHGNNFSAMIGTVWSLEEAVAAAIKFVEQPDDEIDWDNTLLIVTADHATGGMRLNDALPLGKGDLPEQVGSIYPGGELTYNTGGHTNELVTIYARGARLNSLEKLEGAWYPDTFILDNTQVFQAMSKAAGLK